jgi:hypothetical protein
MRIAINKGETLANEMKQSVLIGQLGFVIPKKWQLNLFVIHTRGEVNTFCGIENLQMEKLNISARNDDKRSYRCLLPIFEL